MNPEIRAHLNDSLDKGVRFDGREPDELREIEAETGVISTAEGSARVKFGDTDVIAGVKLSLGDPFPDTPDEGVLMVNAERLALSSPEFEGGRPGIESIEISRVIDRGLRESGILDTKELCIEEGEDVWMVNVDVVPINYDGNLMDVGGLAAMLALQDARFPEYSEEEGVNYEEMTDKKLPITDENPLPITVCKIGDNHIVDPLEKEEEALDARLTVTSFEDGTLCAMQKGGDTALSIDEIMEMVDLAQEKADEIRDEVEL